MTEAGQRSFAGHSAVVTGAGRGIGRDIAFRLADAGARVTAVARSEADLESLATSVAGGPGSVVPVAADVRDAGRIDQIMHGADADLLVTAAGTNRPGPLTEVPLEDAIAVLEINVAGTLVTCRAFGAAALAAGRSGSVVTISSQMGAVGYPGRVPYCASKHAVNGLTKALALEWAPHGIRVNAVAPTFVLTPMTAPMLADPEFADAVVRRIPLGRIAEVGDVTAAVCFLLSDDASMVTGHILAVDGGWTAQ
jgi:NAD(P)-dependent dehydrogenase (short-subunit alcohol dehydrogenase family)